MIEQNTECTHCGFIFKIKAHSKIKGKIVAICPQCRNECIIGISKIFGEKKKKIEKLKVKEKSSLLEKEAKEKKEELSPKKKEKKLSKRKIPPSKRIKFVGIMLLIFGIFGICYSINCLINHENMALHYEEVLKHEKKIINSTNRLVIYLGEKKEGENIFCEVKLEKGEDIDVYIVDEENHSKLKKMKNATPIKSLKVNSSKREIKIKVQYKNKYYLESLYSNNKEIKIEVWYYEKEKRGSSLSEEKLIFYSIFVLISSFIMINAGIQALKLENFKLVFLGAILLTFSMLLSWITLILGIIIFIIIKKSKDEFS